MNVSRGKPLNELLENRDHILFFIFLFKSEYNALTIVVAHGGKRDESDLENRKYSGANHPL